MGDIDHCTALDVSAHTLIPPCRLYQVCYSRRMDRYAVPDPMAEDALARLGRNIAAWRKLHTLTQVELARRAGVSRPVVTRLERGEEGVGIGALMRVLGVLRLDDAVAEATDPFETRFGRELVERTLVQRVRR